jgi:HEAT repeat protein
MIASSSRNGKLWGVNMPEDTMDALAARIELLLEQDGWARTREEIAGLGPSAVPILIAKIEQGGPELKFIERAVLALGEIGGSEAQAFLATLLDHENPILRAAAVTALGQAGGVGHAQAVHNLLSDEDGAVRKEAARTLAKIGDENSIEPLESLARDEGQRFLKEEAQGAVEEIKKRQA